MLTDGWTDGQTVETHRPDLIHIPIKLHEDISNSY